MPSSSLKEISELEGARFRCAWRSSFFKLSISLYMALFCCSWENWLSIREWLLLVCVVCNLSISPTFTIEEIVLSLGPRRLLLMRTWSYHASSLHSLLHKFSSQTALIVGTRFAAQVQEVWDLGPVSLIQ